jgi:hypothetical protein
MKQALPIILLMFAVDAVESQSLRERAKNQGGRAENMMTDDSGIATLPYLVEHSDLVIHGRVLAVTTGLFPDESAVYTDCQLTPIRLIKNRVLPIASQPGQLTPLVARRPGGVLIEGQLRMVTTVNSFPESEALKVGDEAVLFLTRHPEGQFYYFTGGPFGAFRVRQGRIEALTKDAALQRGDSPRSLKAFLGEVEGLLAQRQ